MPAGRQAKQKARIKAYEELLAESREQAPGSAQILIPTPPRLGDLVIEAEGCARAFGDHLLIEDLSFAPAARRHRRRDRSERRGQDHPVPHDHRSGEPECRQTSVGDTVSLGYVDQSRDSAGRQARRSGRRFPRVPTRSTWASARWRRVPMSARSTSREPDQQSKVGQLSGGERNRVHLAKMLKSGANVILLDEPTNDLDVETLRALEEALLSFPGCAVIISHDRWFLDRIATHILAFEGNSQVVWFEGNYEDYEADRHRRLGADADQPHRIRYKPLKRA